MKKFFTLMLSLIMAIACLGAVACKDKESSKLTVAAPDGAPIMAIAQMMRDCDDYNYSVSSAEEIESLFTKAETDFIVAPTDTGMEFAILEDKYQVIATTSWGNLYLLATESEDIKTFAECSNIDEFLSQFNEKSVSSIGSNKVPDKSFRHLLEQKQVSCTINPSNAPNIQAGLTDGDIAYGILGEPAVTAITTKPNSGVKVLCSIGEIWKAVVGTNYPQASVFAKASLSDEQIDTFLTKLESSISYLNTSDANAEELGNYLQNRGDSTLKGLVVKKAYLNMNQNFVLANECKQEIINFISVLGVTYNAETDSGVFYEKVTN